MRTNRRPIMSSGNTRLVYMESDNLWAIIEQAYGTAINDAVLIYVQADYEHVYNVFMRIATSNKKEKKANA